MPSHPKSPYTTSFVSAVKRGTPAGQAVLAIAKRHNTRPSAIFNSLYKAGICERQKFNGQWIYWPCEPVKTSATQAKAVQVELWQNLIDWCIVSGQVTPQQLINNIGSQPQFMSYCKKFFARQASGATSTTKTKTTGRKSTRTARGSRTDSYKFPRTSSARRMRRAA